MMSSDAEFFENGPREENSLIEVEKPDKYIPPGGSDYRAEDDA